MIPCLKTRRALLRRVLYVSAMRARLTARAKPSSLWILPHRNRALETSQKICLSAPAFPCRARESKSCQVQYPQRLRPRCPPSSASVRDCTTLSSTTCKEQECPFFVGKGRKLPSAPVGAAKPPVRGPSTQRRQRCPTADPKASGRTQHRCRWV